MKLKLIGKFQEYEHPEDAELHQLSTFTKYHDEITHSRYVKGLNVEKRVETFVCPRCKAHFPGLEYGDAYECEGCGLKFQSYGNALYLWE